MKEQIKIFGGLNQILLGKEAKTTEGIWDFYKLIKKNESALKYKFNNDNLLPTKVCISMCSKVQQWLAQCEIAQDRSEVNNGIFAFSGILEDIWENRFLVHLPSMFKVKLIDKAEEIFTALFDGIHFKHRGKVHRKPILLDVFQNSTEDDNSIVHL